MVAYRRYFVPGGTYFFTATLKDRTKKYLTEHINLLGEAMRLTAKQFPYETHAIVVMPNHLHTLWELPAEDINYPLRWAKIKHYFTQALLKKGIPLEKNNRGEYQLWQSRFWEHTIRNDRDYENHVNYIHYNPIKHGFVNRTRDWKYSSFHRYVTQGYLRINWCDNNDITDPIEAGEFE